jgi:hypothetical protein
VATFGTEASTQTNKPSPSPYGLLPQPKFAFLKQLFRSIARMMQTAGVTDGLRNLIDSSLTMSVKLVMEHQKIFGPQIFALGMCFNDPRAMGRR